MMSKFGSKRFLSCNLDVYFLVVIRVKPRPSLLMICRRDFQMVLILNLRDVQQPLSSAIKQYDDPIFIWYPYASCFSDSSDVASSQLIFFNSIWLVESTMNQHYHLEFIFWTKQEANCEFLVCSFILKVASFSHGY